MAAVSKHGILLGKLQSDKQKWSAILFRSAQSPIILKQDEAVLWGNFKVDEVLLAAGLVNVTVKWDKKIYKDGGFFHVSENEYIERLSLQILIFDKYWT